MVSSFVNIVNAISKMFSSCLHRTSVLHLKGLFFADKRLVLCRQKTCFNIMLNQTFCLLKNEGLEIVDIERDNTFLRFSVL